MYDLIKKPSVTALISLLDKPALLSWANKKGLEGLNINDIKKAAFYYGNSLHYQIENFVNNGECFEDPKLETKFLNFISDKEIISVEKKIETKYFKGKYDMKLKYKNEIYIIDFKSNKKKVYLENILQLVSYSMAEKCDKLAIVSLPEFKFLKVDIKDKKPYIEIIKSLSKIYYNKQII